MTPVKVMCFECPYPRNLDLLQLENGFACLFTLKSKFKLFKKH